MGTVSPKKLIAAVRMLSAIPVRTGLSASSFVRLHEKKKEVWMSLSAEMSGSIHVKRKGSIGMDQPLYLDRASLLPFIFGGSKYKSDKPFVFTAEKDKLLITQGRRKASFQHAAECSGYLDSKALAHGTELIMSDKLTELLKVASQCAASDQTAPTLDCVFMKRGENGIAELLSTNQLVTFSAESKEKNKFPKKLPFPLQLIPFLEMEGMQSIQVHEQGVVLNFENGYIWQPLSEKAEKGFPVGTIEGLSKGMSYKYLDRKKRKQHGYFLPKDAKKTLSSSAWPEMFRIRAYRLGSVVDRFSDYLGAAKKEEWIIQIRAEKGDKHVLFGSLAQQAEFHERVPVDTPIKEAFSLSWPLDVLLPVFKHLAKTRKTEIGVRFGSKTPYLLSADGISLVVTRRS